MRKMDQFVIEKILILENIKKEALKQEDYDQGKQIKTVVDKLKITGNQIYKKNQEKDLAVENEDYEVAKHLKRLIEEAKDAVKQMGSIEQENQQTEEGEFTI